MTLPPLRPYQVDAYYAVLDGLARGIPSSLVVAATGTGKTTTLAYLAQAYVQAGVRVLVLAHREEIIEQLRDRCAMAELPSGNPIPVGIERAGIRSSGEPIVVASVQSLDEERLDLATAYGQAPFGLVLVDEAHHAVARSYRRTLDPLRAAGVPIVGFTATPDRSDGRPLSEVFDHVAHQYDVDQAMRDGYLTPFDRIPVEDWTTLGDALRGRRAVVFAPSVADSMTVTDALASQGIPCCHIDGETENRADLLARFESGEFNVVCNYNVLTEGWDAPDIDVVVVMRNSRGRGTRMQMIGRGLRLAPGKRRALVLETPSCAEMSLAPPSDPLVGEPIGAAPRGIPRARARSRSQNRSPVRRFFGFLTRPLW